MLKDELEDKKHNDDINITWNRLHYLSPLLMFWKTLGMLAGLFIYNVNQHINLRYIYETASHFSMYIAMGAGTFLLLIIVFCYLSWTRMGYAIDKINVYYKHGIIFKKERYIRISRIQTVDIVYPILGRIFGLGQIKIESAGASESNIIIAYMKEKQLQDLRNTVLALMAGVKTNKRYDLEDEKNNIENNTRYFENKNPITSKEKLGVHDLKMYAKEAPEKQVYEINYKKYVLATIASFIANIFILTVISLTIIILGFSSYAVSVLNGSLSTEQIVFSQLSLTETIQVMIAALSVILAMFTAGLWKPLSKNFGYKLKISPDGFRIKAGLTSLKHETIPPNRIHALIIQQPLTWRIFDSWQVKTIKAAVMEGQDDNDNEIMVPIEDTRNINSLVHLVYKKLLNTDISIEKDEELLLEGLLKKKKGQYFKPLAPIARVFHPFAFNRMSYCITENVVLIRSGFLTRKLAIIPHERAQSLGIEQGYIAQKLNIASLHMDLVKMSAYSNIPCLPIKEAKENLKLLNELFRIKRLAEPKEEWMRRVYKNE